MYNKTIIKFGFCDIRNFFIIIIIILFFIYYFIFFLGKCNQPRPPAQLVFFMINEVIGR